MDVRIIFWVGLRLRAPRLMGCEVRNGDVRLLRDISGI
jgi:hypothetical protein